MDTLLALFVMALVLGVVGVCGWAILRAAHAREFTAMGWRFERDPGTRPVWGLNRPPFGRGGGRRVRELVSGSVEGTPFHAVVYSSNMDNPPGWVVVLPLPRSLPPAVVGALSAFPRQPGGSAVPAPRGFSVWAEDRSWGEAVRDALGPVASELAGAGLAVSLDGAALVGLGVGGRATDVQAAVPLLARAVQALSAAPLGHVAGPPVPPEMSLTTHPDWVYRSRDDSMLAHVRAARGGYDHAALDVLFLNSSEVGFIALTHTWTTRRTVTEAGPNGTMTTRTVEDHHREELFEITLGFPFVDLSVNKSFDWGRGRVRFESEDFNEAFAVRCRDARFASNIFHPRQMQFLQQSRPPAFEIEGAACT